MGIVDAVDDLVLQPLFGVRGGGLQALYPVDDIDCEVEAVDLIENRKLQRRVDVALFLIPADVDVSVVGPAISELVDERRVGVEVEDDGLVAGEQAVELLVA